MAATFATQPLAAAGSASFIGSIFVQAVNLPLKWYETRETRRQLMALTDHELADIGLSRNDIAHVAKLG